MRPEERRRVKLCKRHFASKHEREKEQVESWKVNSSQLWYLFNRLPDPQSSRSSSSSSSPWLSETEPWTIRRHEGEERTREDERNESNLCCPHHDPRHHICFRELNHLWSGPTSNEASRMNDSKEGKKDLLNGSLQIGLERTICCWYRI